MITLVQIIDGAIFTFVFDDNGELVKLRRSGVDVTHDGRIETHAFKRLEEMGVNMQERISNAIETKRNRKGAG